MPALQRRHFLIAAALAAAPGPASPVLAAAGNGRPLSACEGEAPAQPLPGVSARLVEFEHSPFPYDCIGPTTGKAFLNTVVDGRRGRATRRGLFTEEQTYSDRRVLLAVPDGFDPAKPAAIIVFFHGNEATLARDVIARQGIPGQLAESGVNAVLVAPQFAVDARDSSAGRFWEPGFFEAFLAEAGGRIARCLDDDDDSLAARFDRMPVVLVAYSGGYNPAAAALRAGGARDRIAGVALFDALYGERKAFEDWIQQGQGFFVSAFGSSTRMMNSAFAAKLASDKLEVRYHLPQQLGPRVVTFVDAGKEPHADFMSRAWTASPLADLLKRLTPWTAYVSPDRLYRGIVTGTARSAPRRPSSR